MLPPSSLPSKKNDTSTAQNSENRSRSTKTTCHEITQLARNIDSYHKLPTAKASQMAKMDRQLQILQQYYGKLTPP